MVETDRILLFTKLEWTCTNRRVWRWGMGGTIPQGITPCNLGQTGGVEKVTLSPLNMPQHTHSATTSTSNLTVSNMNVAIPAASQGEEVIHQIMQVLQPL